MGNRLRENRGGVEHPPGGMPLGPRGRRETMRDRKVVERPKDVLPGVAPGSFGTRSTSDMSPGHSRFQRRLAKRIDRLARRMQRRRERLAARSERLDRGVESRRLGLTFRFRRRWFLLIDRVELVIELLQVRWYRLMSRIPDLRARRRRGSASRRGALVAAGVSVALAVTAIAVLPLDTVERDAPVLPDASPSDPSPDPPFSPEPSGDPELFPTVAPSGFSTYTNEAAGYLFSYPVDWEVSKSPTATVLSDPGGQVVISFDSAPPGLLETASDQVVEELTNAYVGSEIIATDSGQTPQDYPSMVVGGIATDASGTDIRFLVVTIEGPEDNRALSIRFPADTDPDDLGTVLAVVGSFRFDSAASP
jgi:hypothetical protein